ncbi:calcium permeable stress-gated cation channel [Geosmithia morbida]|uniref:Calcium permeable stress-gated cation channel n=1 Tax=Geosmithia morbida TaxID=1094350 RepID=A0A9P5D6K3_9HYPO|nr:calcium permeable stress-gated cation channel [Geosmithia morbida]KAF4124850.1 calcium permeable stress-gated cation channel [Geosmithia morbida]
MASAMASANGLASRSLQDFIDNLTKQNSDPRVGSGREGSSGGTLSGSNGSKSASLSKLGSTFIPVIVYVAVCLLVFIVARRRYPRVYAPRTISALRSPETPAPALPRGWFNWIVPFFKVPDTFVLNHGSLDGFFFLRFLKVLRNVCFFGCLISWPILFPLHATGGNGEEQLEKLTIGNVSDPARLYANAVVAWLLFGFVLFTVSRETVYYINMRQAYLSSPYYAKRLSSRTVMFSSVPRRYLDEARIRKLFGDSVRRVWLPRTSKHLANLVKEREQTALRLEKAEIALIKKVNSARAKQLRSDPDRSALVKQWEGSTNQLARAEEGHSTEHYRSTSSEDRNVSRTASGSYPSTTGETAVESIELAEANKEKDHIIDYNNSNHTDEYDDDEAMYIHPYGLNVDIPDVRGSVASLYITAQQRPYHRPIANYGRRIDTIRWTRRRLIELNRDIAQMRKKLKSPNCKTSNTLPAAFVEFDSQEAAQAAHQSLTHHQPLHMAPRLIGVRPDEVVWETLRMRWWERIMRRFLVQGFIVAAIIFWSIPSAVVGIISNVESLSSMFPWLNWILDLPSLILGLLTGFVPALALSFFMALVPVIMRKCARAAGVPVHSMVELFTQTAYFAFQVVQVFLITTLTSAASSAFFKILMDPVSAKDVLAQNLPKASNFYISYILIQCLANSGTQILQPFQLMRQGILSHVAQTPRGRHRAWHTMIPPRWGRDFPVFANLGVIALAYTCIAPLILAFAGLGMGFTHIVWRYNLIYVYEADMDSKGLFYPRALNHLIVGLYLAEICLIGLFFLNGATGPGVLIIMLFVFTGLIQYSISQAIGPLLQNLPQTLKLEEDIQDEERAAAEAAKTRQDNPESEDLGAANSYYDTELTFGEEDEEFVDEDDDEVPTPIGNRALEGAGTVRDTVATWAKGFTKKAAKNEASSMGIDFDRDFDAAPNFITKWFNPHIHEDFIAIRKNLMTLPDDPPDLGNDPRQIYHPPEMWETKPILWIPRDEARVSRQEVAHTRKSTPISDKGAHIDSKGRIVVDVEAAPFMRPRLVV